MPSTESDSLPRLLGEVRALRKDLLAAEADSAEQIDAVRPRHRASALNLVHYVRLRRQDLRELQGRLAEHGLSSMGRMESHVLENIDAVLDTLERLTGLEEPADSRAARAEAAAGSAVLARNALGLLGPPPKGRNTRIMVTLPSEAATDPALVHDMLVRGMDIARINCAHDGPGTWDAMIANIRAAEAATSQRCLISMDLGGPKLRAGPIRPGPQVLKVKPIRDELGAVVEPGRVWLGSLPPGETEDRLVPVVPLQEADWAGRRRPGQRIRLLDARGAKRTLRIERVSAQGALAVVRRSVYFVPGTELLPKKGGPGAKSTNGRDRAHVGALPEREQSMLVRRGDRIVLSADLTPAEATPDPATPGLHRIGCTLPEIFADAKPGERVLIDDGTIAGVITQVAKGELTVEVRHAAVLGSRLRAGKGVNLPDTRLHLSALTDQDVVDLDYVREHADIVEMSFVRDASDVRDLLARVDSATGRALDIVLKIETVAGFAALPQILLEAMRWEDIGVMIARGDLAVEAGFERLAEVQEEMLWLCEAAHVPVIWATEVLDSMARTGVPSRAEVTDAAMAERAECVMLNKGPFIDEAIGMLASILGRMQDHTSKKRSLLRRLRSWDLDADAGAARR